MPDAPRTHLSHLSYLTSDLPGTGGVLKQRPEDFLVEELPLYEPAGEGEHLYLYIEKKGATTLDLARRLAKAFRVKRRDVSYAGLKDKHAVTRQLVSIWRPGSAKADDAEALERFARYPYASVLWVDRHTNKLRRGHHGGNRFVIYVRDVEPTAVLRAKPIVDRLAREGFPNYIGEQRFGYRQNSHTLGKLLLHGRWQALLDELIGGPREDEHEDIAAGRAAYDAGDIEAALEKIPGSLRAERQALDALRQHKNPEQAVHSIDRTQRDFFVSAAQSAVFNAVLDRRLRAETFPRLRAGDLAWKHDNRSCFAVDQATAEIENSPDGRVSRLEVSPSGPLWGHGMTRAAPPVADDELAALTDAGLSPDDFADRRHLSTDGTRRPLREMLIDPELSGGVDEHGAYLRLSFTLRRGTYATVALREVTKA